MADSAQDTSARPTRASGTKVDPETLALRGQPGRVVRFRRGVIIAIAAAGSISLVAVAWLALKPASLAFAPPSDEWPDLAAAGPPDALADSPRDYGEVPQLGPPLPGDLGGPILERQRQSEAASASNIVAEEAERERSRREAEQLAARQSGLMMQVAARPSAGAVPVRPDAAAAIAGAGWVEAADAGAMATRASTVEQPGLDPGEEAARSGDVNPHALVDPPSPWTLLSGTVIAASLVTGLNSDLPGFVTAQVTEHVYDSLTGRILLVPQGSRLVGSYDSVVAFGQSRALVVWKRIILPDGSSIRVDDLPATDVEGHAGLSDRIDRHSWQLLKGVALSTLLGVGTELGLGSSESDLVRAVRESAQQSGSRAGDQVVMRQLGVQPTLRVRPGWPLRVVVHKDLVLRPWNSRKD